MQFSLVLNSKKTAIQELTDEVEEARKTIAELKEQVAKVRYLLSCGSERWMQFGLTNNLTS